MVEDKLLSPRSVCSHHHLRRGRRKSPGSGKFRAEEHSSVQLDSAQDFRECIHSSNRAQRHEQAVRSSGSPGQSATFPGLPAKRSASARRSSKVSRRSDMSFSADALHNCSSEDASPRKGAYIVLWSLIRTSLTQTRHCGKKATLLKLPPSCVNLEKQWFNPWGSPRRCGFWTSVAETEPRRFPWPER